MPPANKPSPAVYRRRRLVALLACILVIAVVWWGISALADDKNEDAGPTSPAEGSDSEPIQTVGGEVPSVEAEAPTPAPTPTPTEEGTAVCGAGEVTVTAITDAETYGGDQQPKISMKLRNNSDKPCVIDVGTAAQEYVIKSGEDVIWVSTHCQKDKKPQTVQLDPSKEVTGPQLTWVRERSTPDTCDSDNRPKAVAGGAYYSLTVTVGGISSEPVYFALN